ncbi:hypothetical protein ACWDOP_01230 [Nocardia sp. NPDC003693]
MNDQTVYPGSRGAQIMLVIFAPVIGVLGVLTVMVEELGPFARTVWGGGTLIFALVAIPASVLALIRNRPELVLDGEGVLVPPHRKVLWHEVAAVRLRPSGRSNAVEILLNEAVEWDSPLLRRVPTLRPSSVFRNESIMLSPVKLHPYSTEAILIEMLHYCPGLRIAPPGPATRMW